VAHKSKLVNQWAAKHPRLHLEYFPPYAPDLNPTEYVWGNLKYHRMANCAAPNVTELAKSARRHCRQLQSMLYLLFACLRHSGLFLAYDRAFLLQLSIASSLDDRLSLHPPFLQVVGAL